MKKDMICTLYVHDFLNGAKFMCVMFVFLRYTCVPIYICMQYKYSFIRFIIPMFNNICLIILHFLLGSDPVIS